MRHYVTPYWLWAQNLLRGAEPHVVCRHLGLLKCKWLLINTFGGGGMAHPPRRFLHICLLGSGYEEHRWESSSQGCLQITVLYGVAGFGAEGSAFLGEPGIPHMRRYCKNDSRGTV